MNASIYLLYTGMYVRGVFDFASRLCYVRVKGGEETWRGIMAKEMMAKKEKKEKKKKSGKNERMNESTSGEIE